MAWQDRALCATAFAGQDLWFSEHLSDRIEAKKVCEECPVRAACLEHALTLPLLPTAGVWAGKSDRTIRRIRSERSRA